MNDQSARLNIIGIFAEFYRAHAATLRHLDLHNDELGILSFLRDAPAEQRTATRITAYLDVTKGFTTYLIGKLEKRSLVQRAEEVRAGSRWLTLSLTDQGLLKLKEVQDLNELMLADLSSDEREIGRALGEALLAVTGRVKHHDPSDLPPVRTTAHQSTRKRRGS